MIDASIVSSLPPLPSIENTENADMTTRREASNGCCSSDRTLTSSAALRARTPTSPPAPMVPGQPEQNKCEVTQAICRSTSRIGTSYPSIQIHTLVLSVQVATASSKRQRVGTSSNWDSRLTCLKRYGVRMFTIHVF